MGASEMEILLDGQIGVGLEKELERLRCLLDSSEKTLKTVSTIYDEISDNSQAEKRQEVRV